MSLFQAEFPIPEQFKTTVSSRGLSTTVVESKGQNSTKVNMRTFLLFGKAVTPNICCSFFLVIYTFFIALCNKVIPNICCQLYQIMNSLLQFYTHFLMFILVLNLYNLFIYKLSMTVQNNLRRRPFTGFAFHFFEGTVQLFLYYQFFCLNYSHKTEITAFNQIHQVATF